MAVAAVTAARKIREEEDRQHQRDARAANDFALEGDSEDDEDDVQKPVVDSKKSSTKHSPAVLPHAALGSPSPLPSRSSAGDPTHLSLPGSITDRNLTMVHRSSERHSEQSAAVATQASALGALAVRVREVEEPKRDMSLRAVCSNIGRVLWPAPQAPSGGAAGEFPMVLPYQAQVLAFYSARNLQLSVAAVILGNFVTNATQSQLYPGGLVEVGYGPFNSLELAFNSFFLVELIVNMYSAFLWHFWKSAWNIFDLTIVLVSWIAMFDPSLPGVNVLRLFRAFRVFRLFKRVESLRRIIEGVVASLPGVGNAFVVLGILMGIWSVIGVEFFGLVDPEDFGNFLRAMFTLWQVTTGDSGYSGIARPLLYDNGLVVAAPYFVSFGFVASIVMTNVVIAILLDAYLRKTLSADGARAAAEVPRMPLRERLWLLSKVLREGKSEVAKQKLAAIRMQKSVRAHIDRRKKKEDLPHRRAMRALAAVISAAIADTFSEEALSALSSRERLGMLATLWSSRNSRELITTQQLQCSEKATFLFAKLPPSAALAHVLLVRLQERADDLERLKKREKAR